MKWQLWCVVLVAAAAAFLPMNPASTWTHAAGAPQAHVAPDPLSDTRRATADAAAQLSLLTAGTSQLVSGAGDLDEGAVALADAIAQARAGAHELSGGMVELQAGTGQLGAGATQLADSVGEIVAQVAGFEAVRGQVVAAIDRSLESTKDSRDPDVVAMHDTLKELRQQALTAEIPADAVAKMTQLRDGSRDLANQLAVPGYAYHDGIYTATNGAASLATGLSELEAQVQEASGGISQLVDGSTRLDTLANQSASSVSAVRASLPAAVASGQGAGPGDETRAGAGERSSTLAPVGAMLLAALAVLGGTALGAAISLASRGRGWVLGAGTVITTAAGTLLTAMLGAGLGAQHYAVVAAGLALGTLAAAGLTRALANAWGPAVGLGVAGTLALAQVGVVGWVWRTAAATAVSGAWVAVSQAMPMHWATAAVSAAGNGGDGRAIVSALLASAALAAVGLAAPRRTAVE